MNPTAVFSKLLLAGAILSLSCSGAFAQTSTLSPRISDAPNAKLIKTWYTAWEKKDWNSLQQILADGFTFSSPLDDHINVKTFKQRCWPNAYMIKRFDVDKLVVEGDVAFVITDGWTTGDKLFRNTDYFLLKNGKISSFECFFGPGVNFPNSGK